MADSDPTSVPDDPAAELVRVRSYKLARLREFGYAEPDARELSEWEGSGVDVHYVQALIAHGASLSEAARIAR